VEFRDRGGSGRGYDEYPAAVPLSGVVTDTRGRQLRGLLVFDLDEMRSWEFLNGKRLDTDYDIPFGSVKSIVPRGGHASLVVLKNGVEVVLDDEKDVSEDNDGIVILTGARDTYVAWRDVDRIDFD
jgi:hypothetical protein